MDEQNTMNAMEIRKREAKVFILQRQQEDLIEEQRNIKENLDTESGMVATDTDADTMIIQKHITQ